MQNLYAFYVCKQANYECALDQIRLDFTPDVFADPPADKEQLARDQTQALALFQSLFKTAQTTNPETSAYDGQVAAVVAKARLNYENEVAKDLKRLQSSWEVAVNKIRQACLYILQLLIAWTDVALQQAERPKLSQQPSNWGPPFLAHNRILERLRANTAFTHLVKQHTISWADKADLVVSWYNQFVKNKATLQYDSSQITTLTQEKELLVDLLQAIILEKEAIQEFFSDLDLSWIEHKQIVSKMLSQALAMLEKNTEKDTSLKILESSTASEEARHFYTDLISKTLAQDQELDAVIKQHIKNWTIDRVMLLDKTILKLAMCEMIYFERIPVKVSMNEYLDLSKAYSTPKSSQFINGILDAVAKTR